jgi:hypothetical protein
LAEKNYLINKLKPDKFLFSLIFEDLLISEVISLAIGFILKFTCEKFFINLIRMILLLLPWKVNFREICMSII